MKIRSILDDKGRDVHTIRADTDVTVAARLMRNHGIAALVVTSAEQRVVGILGERDIVLAVATHDGTIAGTVVGDLMTPQPVTCSPDDGITDVMATMTRQRRRHLPVLEDGHLVGVVSIGDMVKFRLGELELESRVLRDAYLSKH